MLSNIPYYPCFSSTLSLLLSLSLSLSLFFHDTTYITNYLMIRRLQFRFTLPIVRLSYNFRYFHEVKRRSLLSKYQNLKLLHCILFKKLCYIEGCFDVPIWYNRSADLRLVQLPFSIFSTIHLNMFLNIFHATLGIKLILSKHRTEETNDELMMPLVKRINTYICTYLSMYESKYKNYHQNNDELTHVPIS